MVSALLAYGFVEYRDWRQEKNKEKNRSTKKLFCNRLESAFR
jgi:hypothetical protein